MSVLVNRVLRGFYLDSVALMRISRSLNAHEAVDSAALMIGSPANRGILADSGLLAAEGEAAHADDLVIAIRARDAAGAEAALAAAEALLAAPSPRDAGGADALARTRRIETAIPRLDGANLALISVPGEFAAAQARRALAAGLHVMVFSDNVPIAEEVALKRLARERGLLVMGPDCGTCLIGGAPLAFANAVPRGPVGIVSASGTGLQEIATLLARAGVGIAHGIGVGGRDLSETVGGLGTLAAIDALDADPLVERLVLVSKPPARAVAARIADRIGRSPKPWTVCFLGARDAALPPNATHAATLKAAAEHCLGAPLPGVAAPAGRARLSGRVVGLYSGGTLCAEAQDVLLGAGLRVASNAPVPGAARDPGTASAGHVLVDLGADEYTRGRPHPMIDPEVRAPAVLEALRDPSVAVVLVDVVLGYGSHADPAGALVAVIAKAGNTHVRVVASVTGTEADPQGYSAQRRILERAGVMVAPSNADAAAVAAALVAP